MGAGEGVVDLSFLASFLRTASRVLWSAVEEIVFCKWRLRKSLSSLVMRLEDFSNVEEFIKGRGEGGFFLLERVCLSSGLRGLVESLVRLVEGADMSEDIGEWLKNVFVACILPEIKELLLCGEGC